MRGFAAAAAAGFLLVAAAVGFAADLAADLGFAEGLRAALLGDFLADRGASLFTEADLPRPAISWCAVDELFAVVMNYF